MPRETLDRKIRHLLDEILVLDSMVENATISAVDALKNRNVKLAQQVYEGDKAVNAKRFELENECMNTIATQQPIMARDLRQLASILEVVGELERMGDYAKGIANINVRMGAEKLLKPLIDIPRMAEKGVSMLHRALTAFVNEDVEAAKAIPLEDDEVDALYNQIYRELMIFVIEDPKNIERVNWLLWVAHNLERVADRVTNICERTIFIATGSFGELKDSDDEFWKG